MQCWRRITQYKNSAGKQMGRSAFNNVTLIEILFNQSGGIVCHSSNFVFKRIVLIRICIFIFRLKRLIQLLISSVSYRRIFLLYYIYYYGLVQKRKLVILHLSKLNKEFNESIWNLDSKSKPENKTKKLIVVEMKSRRPRKRKIPKQYFYF